MVLSGCEDDPVDVGSACDPSVTTNIIISNPLTPTPGDTTVLTVQATGEGCGNWAAYRWTSEDGELVEDQGITVRWVAPMEYGAYPIRCVASLTDAAPDTSISLIMVREFEYIDTGKKASVWPKIIDNAFYFAAEEGNYGPRNNNFIGWAIFKMTGGSITKFTDTGEDTDGGSYEFDYSTGASAIYGSFVTAYYLGIRQQRMNVWKFPLQFANPTNASSDPGGSGIFRKNQHRYPKTNQYGSKAVWRYQFAGMAGDGTKDLFNIVYWDELAGGGSWYTVTTSLDSALVISGSNSYWKYRYFQNIMPMFTPSEDNILYYVDTTGVFEPCLIPMVGGAPDTLQRRALMVDQSTGIFEQAGVSVSENTVFEWNPASDFLSFISLGEIVFFDYASEVVAVVNGIENVTEFTWAPDGSQLAAVNDMGIYLVSAGGAVNPNPVFVKELSTDGIYGVNWNHNLAEPQISFRLVRKGKSEVDSWSSLIVVDLTSGMWAYASGTVPWISAREPSAIDYTWMRTMFTEDDMGIYAPFPVLDDVNYPGKDIILFYSHE